MTAGSDRNSWFNSILHATDFSAASDTAFSHALAIAVVGKSELAILHAGGGTRGEAHWSDFPEVRETLTRWGLLPPGSKAADVFQRLGLKVGKLEAPAKEPQAAILDYLDTHAVDLLVLATEGREGLPRWLKPSIAESLPRKSNVATLFVPQGTQGFVPLDNPNISLRRILVPVDEQPNARAAIAVAARCGEILGENVEYTLLHVGDSPEIVNTYAEPPMTDGWAFVQVEGVPVDEIVAAARRLQTDLIVMPTAGHEDFLDMLRGSTSEQVLRRAPCPLLAIPAFED